MRETAWRRWEVAGLFFVLVWGNLFHFVFRWSGQNPLVGVVASVNESVWEHIKLLSVPWILWSVVEAVALRRSRVRVLACRAAAWVPAALFIPAAYYTYVGASGSSVSVINILIFQLAALLAFGCVWRLLARERLQGTGWMIFAIVVLLGVMALLVLWTYAPPELPLFTDPQTGQTGIPKGI